MVHTTATLALLALAAPAILAAPSRQHQRLHRRDEVIVTETVFYTEYYTEGDPLPSTQMPAPSFQAPAVASSQAPAPASSQAHVQLAQVQASSAVPSVVAADFGDNHARPTFGGQPSAPALHSSGPTSRTSSVPVVLPSSKAPVVSSAPAVSSAPIVLPSSTRASVAASSSASSSPSVSAGGKKAGLLYNYETFGSMSAFANDQSSFGWMYNWDSKTDGITGYEFVPMLHAMSDASNFQSAVPSLISGGAKYMLGLNEPDMNGISASQAAQTFVTNMQIPNAGKALLVSPAVSSTVGPNTGTAYLSQFMAACKNTAVVSQACDVHACAVHWYGNAGQDSSFQSTITAAHSACDGKPIWVTEFGLNHAGPGVSASQAAANAAAEPAFLQSAVKWLNEQTFVERYAYFWVQDGFLLNGSQKSTLGQDYVNAAAS